MFRNNTLFTGGDIAKMKFDLNQLRDIKTIRKINANSSKELAIYVDDRKGKVPIFGYPVMCYSPN